MPVRLQEVRRERTDHVTVTRPDRAEQLRVDYGRVLNDTASVGVLLRVLSRAFPEHERRVNCT